MMKNKLIMGLFITSLAMGQTLISFVTPDTSGMLEMYKSPNEDFPTYYIYDADNNYVIINGYKDVNAIDIETNSTDLLKLLLKENAIESSDYLGYPSEDYGQIWQDSSLWD